VFAARAPPSQQSPGARLAGIDQALAMAPAEAEPGYRAAARRDEADESAAPRACCT
jgi:hypothetical protein